MSFRGNLNVSRKTKKSAKLFFFLREKEILKIDKEGNEDIISIS